MRIYLDLDRTLLNTPVFTEAVITAFAQEYGVPAKDFEGQMPGFYVHHGVMQYYDFFGHMKLLGHEASEVMNRLRPQLAERDFLYPDAYQLLRVLAAHDIETSILSYGPEDYQGFKYSLISELQQIPFVATLQFKQDYLAKQSPAESLLVDDRVVTDLPGWCTQFLIDRAADATKSKEGDRLWRINSLSAVETALTVRYNEPNEKGTTDEAD